MTRKASFACKNDLHKCNKASNYLPKSDRISELPDEVVISILSCLGLKEAAKTSVLSHRWEKLWTFTTGILEFDGTETLKDMEWQKLEYERVKFSDWVNRVLKLHQGHSINEFRILFDLDSGSSHDINNWIGYALQKGVKRLELDLRRWVRCDSNEKFTFPGIEKLTFFAKQKVESSFNLRFHSLTAIILKDVNISQEVLDYFFFNCPFLERLSVMGSKSVVYLKASGPLLKLKYLEISNCSEITNIEIYADNLVSFMYSGPKITFKINSAPCLSELSLGDECSGHFIEQLWGHVGFLYRFKTLSVKLNLGVEAPVHYPKFNNLIQLEIDMLTRDYETLLWITSFIDSCPSLRKFAINLAYYDVSRSKLSARLLRETLRNEAHARQARKCRHENLKEVELRGFCGRRSYVELALSLLRTAVSLEKIIIDTRLQVWQHENLPCEFVESHDRTQAYRKSAMKLKKKVPAGVRFVVL